MTKTTKTTTCSCEAGLIYLSEADILAELKEEQGTGKPISFSFGFGARDERAWRYCDRCELGRLREAMLS